MTLPPMAKVAAPGGARSLGPVGERRREASSVRGRVVDVRLQRHAAVGFDQRGGHPRVVPLRVPAPKPGGPVEPDAVAPGERGVCDHLWVRKVSGCL